jgi:hypothetical protein
MMQHVDDCDAGSARGERIDDGDTTRIQNSRTNMAIFHFLLTAPKWSISLFLFLAASYAPLSTPYEAVNQPWRRLQTLAELEALSYQQCAVNALESLHSELEHAAEEEYNRVRRSQEVNQALIQDSQEFAGTCFNSTRNARDLLVQWQDNGMDITWVQNSSICSQTDREGLVAILGATFQLVENELSFIWDDYIQGTKHSMELIRRYAVDRFNYDHEYFVTDRIQPAVDFLRKRSEVELFKPSYDQAEIRSRIRESLDVVESTLEQVKRQIEILESRLEAFSTSVNEFHDAYVDVYDRIVQGAAFVRDILPPGAPLPSFFNVESLPIGDSLLPSFVHFPGFVEELKSTHLFIEDATSQCLNVLNSVVTDIESQANQQLRGVSNEVTSALSTILEFQDYNPPAFVGSSEGITDLFDEIQLRDSLGQVTQDNTERLLDQLKTAEALDARNFIEGPALEFGNSSFSEGSTAFDYLRPTFPLIFIPDLLMLLLSWAFAHTWIIEVAVQAYRLWRLEAMYSRGAIPALPEIDYGDGDEQPDPPTTKSSLLTTLRQVFASPRVWLVIVFAPVFVAITAFWYPHVKTSCENHSSGTYLANHFIAPLLINEANALGNAYFLNAEFQCHQTQRKICDEMKIQGDIQYRSDFAALTSVRAQHNRSVEILTSVQNCVDEDTTWQVTESCCGLKGFTECGNSSIGSECPIDISAVPAAPFRSLDDYLFEAACSEEVFESSLVDARYSCLPLIETCKTIPCAGVNEALLTSQTIKTDCEMELYALGLCSFLLVALYHGIAVNLVCTVLFNGIRQVFWRNLCPDGIRFRTRLREDGTLAKGQEKHDRSERIALAIKRFELSGRLQIVLGSLGLLGWVSSVILLAL